MSFLATTAIAALGWCISFILFQSVMSGGFEEMIVVALLLYGATYGLPTILILAVSAFAAINLATNMATRLAVYFALTAVISVSALTGVYAAAPKPPDADVIALTAYLFLVPGIVAFVAFMPALLQR
jgi:hypothetical protein